MLRNLNRMQKLAGKNAVRLRPHIKTHKTPSLAKLQIELGAKGISCAKISEAEIMAARGIRDICIANVIVGLSKLQKLAALNVTIDHLSVCVDSHYSVNKLSDIFSGLNKPINVLIEMDTGLKRCGLEKDNDILDLARHILSLPGVRLEGILTHAGQAYGSKDDAEREKIGRYEGERMAEIACMLEQDGIELETVSTGSTPTAEWCCIPDRVNEIRPGNYIFYDAIQAALGSCEEENCALSVLATVISNPVPGRYIIDAGSKALNSEKGAHGRDILEGFGTIIGKSGTISRLSEEHGIITGGEDLFLGEKIRIIPNHACVTVNLHDMYFVVSGDSVEDILKIAARGAIT